MDDRVWYWTFKPTARLWLPKHVLAVYVTAADPLPPSHAV
jgi:hypothetical protein